MPLTIGETFDLRDPRKLALPRPHRIPDPVNMNHVTEVMEAFELGALHQENGEFSLMLGRYKRDIRIANAVECSVERAKLQNKALAEKSADGTGKNILEECLPCLSRVSDLSNYTVNIDLIKMFEAGLGGMFGNLINGLKNLLNSTNRQSSFVCSLTNYGNSRCLPDITAIIALLTFYIADLTKSLRTKISVKIVLGFALKILVTPLINQCFGFVDKFIQLIFNVIDCIINDINTQLRKFQIEQGIIDAVESDTLKARVQKLKDKTDKLKIKESKIKEKLLGAGSPLAKFLDLIQSAKDAAESKLQTIIDFINQMFNMTNTDSEVINTAIEKLQSAIAILGILQKLAQELQSGGICTNEELPRFEQTKHFVLANIPGALVQDEDTIIIPSPDIPIPPELIDIVDGLDDILLLNTGDEYTIKVPDAIIKRSECINLSEDQDLITWAKELSKL